MIKLKPLNYLSEEKLEELRKNVSLNRERYTKGDFNDLVKDNGWAIISKDVKVDTNLLASLDGTIRTSVGDRNASLILYKALQGMTPALAREERVWVRLCHIECLEYVRSRWLEKCENDKLDEQVHRHVFGSSLTSIRDDNALSRLWWNMHIAKIADPINPEDALNLILKTADIRNNFVERTYTATRPPLARGVIRAIRRNQWITSTERSFREFMIALNRNGSGVLFEEIPDDAVDEFMDLCIERAKQLQLNGDSLNKGLKQSKTSRNRKLFRIFPTRL